MIIAKNWRRTSKKFFKHPCILANTLHEEMIRLSYFF